MNTFGATRLTMRGLRLAPGVSALIAILVLVAAFLAVASPRQTNAILTATLHDYLAGSAGAVALNTEILNRSIYNPSSEGKVAAGIWPAVPSELSDIRKRLPALSDVVAPGEYAGTASGTGDGFPGSGTATTPQNIGDFEFSLEATPSLQREALLTAGRWPRRVLAGQPVEVVIAEKSAKTLHWHVGQSQRLLGTSGSRSTTVVLVGTIRPRDASSAFWGLRFNRAQLRVQVNQSDDSRRYFGTVWIDSGSWPKLAPSLSGLDISAWYGIDVKAITADRATTVATQLRQFIADQAGRNARGEDEGLTFTSELPSDLVAFAQRSGSSTALIALFELGPAGALAAVILLGLRLLEARRSSIATLVRVRGGSGWQVRVLAAAEIAVWTLPAAIIGLAVALILTPGLGTLPVAVVTAAFCALAPPVAAAVLAEPLGTRGQRSVLARAAGPVVEATVVLIAALVLVVLIARGLQAAESQADPLVELAPLLLAIAITVVLTRVLPFGLRLMSSALRRGNSAVGLVASSGLGLTRRGGVWALFALVVGVGMSVFSLTMVATQQQGVHQAALSQIGSDIVVSGGSLSAHTVKELGELPGVAASASVQTIGEQTLPSSSFTVYTIDPSALAAVQRGIDDSPLRTVRGTETVVANVDSPPATAQLDATGDTVLRLHRVGTTAVSVLLDDPSWMLLDRSELPRTGVFPTTVGVLLRLDNGASPERTASAARKLVDSNATVRTAAAAEAAILESPVAHSVNVTILAATVLTALLCLMVFVMTLAAGAADRIRRGAILRALGFDLRHTTALVFADVAPTAIIGVLAGALTGLGLAAVILHTIDPTAFIGASIPVPLVVNVPATCLVLGGFLAAAVLAATAAVMIDLARPSTAGLQTLGEER